MSIGIGMADVVSVKLKLEEAKRALGATPPNTILAESAYRQALRLDPLSQDAALGLAEVIAGRGLVDEALTVMAPFLGKGATHTMLVGAAEAHKVAGRKEEALSLYRRAAAENPTSAVASHNLAAILGDLSRFEEAETRARQAIAGGLNLPQTWLVLARACMGSGKLNASQYAFGQVVAIDPSHAEGWREMCQLIWMRTGSVEAAIKPLDDLIRQKGADPRRLEIRAMILQNCGDLQRADQTMQFAVNNYPNDQGVRTLASRLAIQRSRPMEGLSHAQAAHDISPTFWSKLAVAEALLALGDAARALPVIDELRQAAPFHQVVIAYQATAWRLLDNARYEQLYDFERMVATRSLSVPKGWRSLQDYLADLTTSLMERHGKFQAHPFGQSLLSGSQVSNLIASADPLIRAFFEAVADPIEAYLEQLGQGADILRSRNSLKVAFEGMWSVRLRGGGGRHVGHAHANGWLSSACYISLPPSIGLDGDRAGWLKFGEPGIATKPHLPAQHFVRPEVGALVLFPSYMWHGTEPFEGDDVRLSIAFDLVPQNP